MGNGNSIKSEMNQQYDAERDNTFSESGNIHGRVFLVLMSLSGSRMDCITGSCDSEIK